MGLGAFDLPARQYQSTQGARRAYYKVFGEEWPGHDKLLRLLAIDVVRATPDKAPLCKELLTRMRRARKVKPPILQRKKRKAKIKLNLQNSACAEL